MMIFDRAAMLGCCPAAACHHGADEAAEPLRISILARAMMMVFGFLDTRRGARGRRRSAGAQGRARASRFLDMRISTAWPRAR